MMNSLPLFYYPSTWLWIDDDRTTLNTMALVFGDKNKIQPFLSGKDCLAYLETYKSPLLNHSFLKSITEDEGYGILERTPIDFDVTVLARLADDFDRYKEITAMVIDYNMPEMDGLELAEATHHIPAQKILLTGKAHEGIAVAGFNKTLIQRFVQKAEEQMTTKILAYLQELTTQYFEKLTNPLLSYLETEALLPQSDPAFVEFFKAYCIEHKIKEYYLIDKQGSFLCIDANGNRFCLVVQSDRGLETWLGLYGDGATISENELDAIKTRKKIPFFGVGQEAWKVDAEKWPQYFYEAEILEGRERYFWTTVR